MRERASVGEANAGRYRSSLPAPAPPGPRRPARSAASLLLALQCQCGNRAAADLMTVMRQGLARRANEPGPIRSASLGQLLPLYLAQGDHEVVFGPGDRVTYTRDWLDGDGGDVVSAAIRRRLDALAEQGDAGAAQLRQVRESLAGLPFGTVARNKLWLAAAIAHRLRNIVRPGTRYLTVTQRAHLQTEVGDRMGVAFTQFSTATQRQQAALRAEAADKAAMAGLVVDVFIGFLAPGIGRGIAALANRLPVGASTAAYRAAVAALDPSRNKDVFNAAWKFASVELKDQMKALYGEGDLDAFLAGLRSGLAQKLQDQRARLPNLSDDELVVLFAAFDASVASEQAYVQQVAELTRRFRSDVRPIGTRLPMGSTGYPDYAFATTTSAAWIEVGGRRRLALVRVEHNVAMSRAPEFVRWVSPEMQEAALAKMQTRRSQVATYRTDQVTGVPR